jgi:hypothetical protein
MRVGLVIYGSLETVSGGFLYDRKLVEYLERKGDAVEVISLPRGNYALHLLDNLSQSLHRRLRSARFDVLLQDELDHPSLFWLNRRLKGVLPYPLFTIVHHSQRAAGLAEPLYLRNRAALSARRGWVHL